ncbi:P-loop containing nucleoside triphosphate hydrolase protein [Cladochytrium replicatum]|nr:P-loop containing nucleoside triphosphate hydrolase protein [Cladochytrium replicatum]
MSSFPTTEVSAGEESIPNRKNTALNVLLEFLVPSIVALVMSVAGLIAASLNYYHKKSWYNLTVILVPLLLITSDSVVIMNILQKQNQSMLLTTFTTTMDLVTFSFGLGHVLLRYRIITFSDLVKLPEWGFYVIMGAQEFIAFVAIVAMWWMRYGPNGCESCGRELPFLVIAFVITVLLEFIFDVTALVVVVGTKQAVLSFQSSQLSRANGTFRNKPAPSGVRRNPSRLDTSLQAETIRKLIMTERVHLLLMLLLSINLFVVITFVILVAIFQGQPSVLRVISGMTHPATRLVILNSILYIHGVVYLVKGYFHGIKKAESLELVSATPLSPSRMGKGNMSAMDGLDASSPLGKMDRYSTIKYGQSFRSVDTGSVKSDIREITVQSPVPSPFHANGSTVSLASTAVAGSYMADAFPPLEPRNTVWASSNSIRVESRSDTWGSPNALQVVESGNSVWASSSNFSHTADGANTAWASPNPTDYSGERNALHLACVVAVFALSQVALYFAVKLILSSLDPFKQKKADAKEKSAKIFNQLGLKDLKLNEYEEIIAAELVPASDIQSGFKDIGGLEPIVDSLKETVIYPLCFPHLFNSAPGLLGAPKGVLLYGPPGCGKTLLAKALAKESGANFINLHVSTLTEKWAQSQKLVHALFSLAKKLQPSIIFIDEIDSFLRERKSNDHEATSMMKAEFMSLWDGLSTGDSTRIVVLGATNRPNDIDKAILRRMPKRFAVKLPDSEQRLRILRILLKDVNLSESFRIEELATRTEGYSGSDLKELCRNAAMVPIRESIRRINQDIYDIKAENIAVRPLQVPDFFPATDESSTKATQFPKLNASLPTMVELD